MADRYWSGGTASWDATLGTKWYTDAARTTLATAVPTASDNVYFDATSGVVTVTISVAVDCLSLICTGFTGTLAGTGIPTVRGDFTLSTGMTYTLSSTPVFAGTTLQTIISAGITLGGVTVGVSSNLTSVVLGDALYCTASLIVTFGRFDTGGNSVNVLTLGSSVANSRSILFRNSTVTIRGSSISFSFASSLFFDAGTSEIIFTSSAITPNFGTNLIFHNVSFTGTASTTLTLNGTPKRFNKLSFPTLSADGLCGVVFTNGTTIDTFVCSGTIPRQRFFIRSGAIGTQVTLKIANWVTKSDIDFRDIAITGAVGTISGTRLGNCQGNAGITFDTPKTVYWNLLGGQNWSANGWALTSGGVTNTNNFPLAQDTVIFNNAFQSVTGTITIDKLWNIGTIDMSARTTVMTLASTGGFSSYGSIIFGTGVISTGTNTVTMFNRGASIIRSNGVTHSFPLTFDTFGGTVTLADAYSNSGATTTGLILNSGTFDANNFNVTAVGMYSATVFPKILRMGSGTWTCTGASGTYTWGLSPTALDFYKDTANIVLSNNTTTARTFAGGGLIYNKLTIGGNTSTSTTTISGDNQFSELASTKTVAHTLAISGTQNIGTWSIKGTVGNVVTLSTAFVLKLIGGRSSGLNYLNATAAITATSSPGEFYMGANSTAATSTGVFLTAAPAPVTRYWRAGSGNWDLSNTSCWSDTAGGGGGFSIPTSVDTVIFDNVANNSSYTITCTATLLRCGTLNFGAPSSGTVTWAGTAPMAIHNSLTLAATGFARTTTGGIILTGTGVGKTLNLNGNSIANFVDINSFGGTWSLLSNYTNTASGLNWINGNFNSNNWIITTTALTFTYATDRIVNLGSSQITLSASVPINISQPINLIFNSGTSTITSTNTNPTLEGGNQVFYDFIFSSSGGTGRSINGNNTFNNLTFASPNIASLRTVALSANQTITNTLTCSGGAPANRVFIKSNIAGTQRILNVAAWTTPTDCDVQDILVTGAVAPLATTRFGNCGGNSGIIFDASKNCYRKAVGNWELAQWASTSTGTPDINYFPLAQDVAYFTNDTTTGTCTLNIAYNVSGIITTNTTTAISFSPLTGNYYGDFITSSGTTLNASRIFTFSGRKTQTVNFAYKALASYQSYVVDTIGGTVIFDGALVGTTLTLTEGTANFNYSVDINNFISAGFKPRVLNLNNSNWLIRGNSWSISSSLNATLDAGTSTISYTSNTSSPCNFYGGSFIYNEFTILGADVSNILSLYGDNTFNILTITKNVGYVLVFESSSTTKINTMNILGTATKSYIFSSTPSYCILEKIGGGIISSDYLSITNCYALPTNTWYAGLNSITNGNSIGWNFTSVIIAAINSGFFFMF